MRYLQTRSLCDAYSKLMILHLDRDLHTWIPKTMICTEHAWSALPFRGPMSVKAAQRQREGRRCRKQWTPGVIRASTACCRAQSNVSGLIKRIDCSMRSCNQISPKTFKASTKITIPIRLGLSSHRLCHDIDAILASHASRNYRHRV